ncbi:MAG TPA: hypothetical protein VFE50_06585 [Cyclobacteriaceae bacterium]|nr:hypothetical protein [Cyclobacteriaceae bacterium]
MKSVLLVLVFAGTALVSEAQESILEKVWATSRTSDGLQEVDASVNKLVTKIGKRHYRNDVRKLYALFMKTHERFLHTYVQYTGIETLAQGRYDCLTATSLFADVLNRAGFQYKIIETNYHIFIMVNTKDGDVLLETTDRLGGFVNDQKKLNSVVSEYQKNLLASATPSHYQYSFSLYRTVSIDQLPGLLYFNQAVNAFNSERWSECSEKLSAASQSTNSPRIAELADLLPE